MNARYHVLVCSHPHPPNTPGGSCVHCWRSHDVYEELVALIKDNRLEDEIRVSTTDCFGLCCMGSIVVVYPDNVWYGKVTPSEGIQNIFNRHLLQGKIVESLLLPEWVWPGAELPAESSPQTEALETA